MSRGREWTHISTWVKSQAEDIYGHTNMFFVHIHIYSNWKHSSQLLHQTQLPFSRTGSERAAKAEESSLKLCPVLKPTLISTQIFNQIQHRGGHLNTSEFLEFSQKRQKGSTSLSKREKLQWEPTFYQTLATPCYRKPYKCIPTGKDSTGGVNTVDKVNDSQSQIHGKMGFVSFSAHRNS